MSLPIRTSLHQRKQESARRQQGHATQQGEVGDAVDRELEREQVRSPTSSHAQLHQERLAAGEVLRLETGLVHESVAVA